MARKKKEKAFNYDIGGVVMIFISLFILISIFTSSYTGSVGVFVKKIIFFMLGIGSYIVPFLFVFIGGSLITKKSKISFTPKFYGLLVVVIDTLLVVQRVNMDKYYNGSMTVIEGLQNLYSMNLPWHGGILAFLIDIPMNNLFGNIGCILIYILIYIISVILIFKIDLKDIFKIFKIFKMPKSKSKTNKEIKISNNDENVNYSSDSNENLQSTVNVESVENNNSFENEEKDSFVKSVNNKIKIVDFLKNSSVDEQCVSKDEDKKSNKKEEIKKLTNEMENQINSSIINGEEYEYVSPSFELLNINESNKLNKEDKRGLLNNANKLIETLDNFGVEAKVLQVTKGPSVTRFELQPSPGIKVSKIVNLADDIALSLAARAIRIEAPIPGKSAIGIEVPNKSLSPVFIREVLDSEEFLNSSKNLAFALGKDIAGRCVVADLTKMPHMLIAGSTGSGKSVCINTLIISLIYKYSPDKVKLLMIDPKVVELNVYNGIPHLLIPVVTDPKKAAGALSWAVKEMTRRYNIFAENNVRNIESYNELFEKGKIDVKLNWIVIIIDELSDLMMVCPGEVEDYIVRLTQMARAAGMHLVIATQRPSVDVITGVIKANIPSRIAFSVSSQVDSRTILDMSGAEKLLGKGDMLFSPVGESKPLRIQGAFISEEEVEKVVDSIKLDKVEVEYHTDLIEEMDNRAKEKENNEDDKDELFEDALNVVMDLGQASASLLQRRLKIGYNRAARIIEQMEEMGIVSPQNGSKPREVLRRKE